MALNLKVTNTTAPPVFYPGHTGSNTGSTSVPLTSVVCPGGSYAVYSYHGGAMIRTPDSPCSDGACAPSVSVSGAQYFMAEALHGIDPSRRFFTCCTESMRAMDPRLCVDVEPGALAEFERMVALARTMQPAGAEGGCCGTESKRGRPEAEGARPEARTRRKAKSKTKAKSKSKSGGKGAPKGRGGKRK